jgi:hypothetical protein
MKFETAAAFHGTPVKTGTTGDPVYFLFHVPKCAGRTIHEHLAAHTPPGSYLRAKKRYGASRFFSTRYELDSTVDAAELRALGGHYLGQSLERLAEDREIRRAILLRDPVSHLVSYYNFRIQLYLRQGMRPYSFELAYRSTQRNFITHYILRNFLELPWTQLVRLTPEEKWEKVNAFLASCWYVGDYRYCGELIAEMAQSIALPPKAIPHNICQHHVQREDWRPLHAETLPTSLVRQIREENSLDQQLWEVWGDVRLNASAQAFTPLETSPQRNLLTTEIMRLPYQIKRRAARVGLVSEHVPERPRAGTGEVPQHV